MARKLGFWIKKDGYVATDPRMSLTNTNREKKIKDQLNELAKKKMGKGTVWLRKTYIPLLQKRIHYQVIYTSIWKRHVKEMDGKCKILIDQIKKFYREKLSEYRKEVYKKFKSEVEESAEKKHIATVYPMSGDRRAKYIGQSFYFILKLFCTEFNVDEKTLNSLIIVNFYKIFMVHYFLEWGVEQNINKCRIRFNKLRKEGYIERVPKKIGCYVLSLKGINFMKEFDDYYSKHSKQIRKLVINGRTEKYKRGRSKSTTGNRKSRATTSKQSK